MASLGPYEELILASTSSARRVLMNGLGLAYRPVAPEVQETIEPALTPHQAVAMLAERKARAVAARFPSALVIGADQLVSFAGSTLGKPPDAATAKAQLAAFRGRTHEICTAVCVAGAGFFVTEVDVARLSVTNLTEPELDEYVATNEWQGCAGSYRIEGKGQALFSRIDGDRTSIQGLPMQLLIRLLREAGVRFF